MGYFDVSACSMIIVKNYIKGLCKAFRFATALFCVRVTYFFFLKQRVSKLGLKA